MGATKRRALAVIACLLWVVGFEALPALHLATHEGAAPHVHGADGTVIHVSFGDEPTHVHADGTIHHHAHRHSHDPGVRTPDGHADGTVGHRGIAAIPAPTPIHAPLPIDRRPMIVAALVAHTPISATTPVAAARGPPSSSLAAS